jgi:sporulation protein YlmC with PRC-barrel domain
MINAHELKDRIVVTVAGGTTLGRVEEVLFDTAQLRVSAFVLELDGIQSVLPFSAVHIGPEALTSGQPVEPLRETADALMRRLGDIVGLRVLNADAKELGQVRSLSIDEETGAVTELVAHAGGMLGMGGVTTTVPAASVRGIGADFVTVETSTAVVKR